MALRIIVSTFTASRSNDQKIQVQMKESPFTAGPMI